MIQLSSEEYKRLKKDGKLKVLSKPSPKVVEVVPKKEEPAKPVVVQQDTSIIEALLDRIGLIKAQPVNVDVRVPEQPMRPKCKYRVYDVKRDAGGNMTGFMLEEL